jgi:hypothetical protein
MCQNPQDFFAGITFDEFVQWIVPDASFDRCDRWGPKLT